MTPTTVQASGRPMFLKRFLTFPRWFLLLAPVLWLPLPSVALELPKHSLADLENGERSLSSLLVAPTEPTGKNEHVKCEGYVLRSGKVGRFYCYIPNRERTPFETNVLESISNIRGIPARIDGKPAMVWLQFSVHFSSQSGNIRVTHDILPEPYPAKYRYKGPQRYFGPRNCRINNAKPILMNYRVTKEGVVEDIGFEMHEKENVYTRRTARCFKATKYLPAQKEGLAIESVVLEPVFNVSSTLTLRRYD